MSKKADLTEQVIPGDVDQTGRCILIDADSIPFILGWTLQKQNLSVDDYMRVIYATDKMMEEILLNSGAESYIGFLGGVHPTFRHILNDTYKANRGQTKPEWYRAWASVIQHRLCYKWGFHTIEGIEAEDAVGMMAKYLGYDKVIIGHIDKDLDQIPGIHYNYSKQRKYFVHEFAAIRNLHYLMLVGDTVDNLPGCPGIGPVKAEKLLAAGDTFYNLQLVEEAYKEAVLGAFVKSFGEEEGHQKAIECYRLTKILEDAETNGFKFPVEEYSPVGYTATQNFPNTLLSSTDEIIGLSNKNLRQVQNLFE